MIQCTGNPVSVAEQLRRGHVPGHYRRRVLQAPRNPKAAEYAERIVESGKGLYLYGKNGTGKTHLASAVLASVVESTGAEVQFVRATDLAGSFRDYKDDATKDRIARIKHAPLTVIDDLDKATAGSDFINENLFEVMAYRYDEDEATIITSNCTLPKLGARYKDDEFARATLSRFGEMLDPHKMDGTDRRLATETETQDTETAPRWYMPEWYVEGYTGSEEYAERVGFGEDARRAFPYRCTDGCTDPDGLPAVLVPLRDEDAEGCVFCCQQCRQVMTVQDAQAAYRRELATDGVL